MAPPDSNPQSIDDWTDEQILLFLLKSKFDDSLPDNVIIDVNPFNIIPWNAPENCWYLCDIQNPTTEREKSDAENPSRGYWKDTRYDDHKLSDSRYTGNKITWTFVSKDAVPDDNFCWMMFEYNLTTTDSGATGSMKSDMKSLCKIFGHNIYPPVLDDEDDHLQSVLLNMLRNESGGSDDSKGSMSTPSEKSRAGQPDEASGDFFELNDLETASTSSDNSSRVCLSSDAFSSRFHSGALIGDFQEENRSAAERATTSSINRPSQSSSSDSSSQQSGTSRVSRIKKLGKYLCFAS